MMAMQELSKQVRDAVTKLDPAIPAHVVDALLAQSEQDVGPCKCRCIHYEDKTVALWRDPTGFSLSHSHPEAQATAILAGKFSLVVGEGPAQQLGPGAVSHIKPNVPHSMEAETAGIALDIFCPRRTQLPGAEVI